MPLFTWLLQLGPKKQWAEPFFLQEHAFVPFPPSKRAAEAGVWVQAGVSNRPPALPQHKATQSRTYTATLDQQIKHDCHACNNQCHLLTFTHAAQYDKTLAVSLVPFSPAMLHATHRDHDMKSHDLQLASIPLVAALCAPSRHSITGERTHTSLSGGSGHKIQGLPLK